MNPKTLQKKTEINIMKIKRFYTNMKNPVILRSLLVLACPQIKLCTSAEKLDLLYNEVSLDLC